MKKLTCVASRDAKPEPRSRSRVFFAGAGVAFFGPALNNRVLPRKFSQGVIFEKIGKIFEKIGKNRPKI